MPKMRNKICEEEKHCRKCEESINDMCNTEKSEMENHKSGLNGTEKRKRSNQKGKWIIVGVIIIISLVLIYYYDIFCYAERYFSHHTDEDEIAVEVSEIYKFDVDHIRLDNEVGIHYIDNVIIVFFEDDATEKQKCDVVESVQGNVVGQIPMINQYQIEIEPCEYDELEHLCNVVESFECVKWAEIDLAIQIDKCIVTNDSWNKFFGVKWDEENPGGRNWWLEAINAPGAWEYNCFFDKIGIGIVDSGVDVEHKELKGKIRSITSNNSDEENHGTHVAGIIGAIPNNKSGIAGIVWNSELFTTDCFISEEERESEAYEDWNTTLNIYWGVIHLITEKKAKVVNLSLGIKNSADLNYEGFIERHGRAASKYLVSILECGYDFLVVQSAGNGNEAGVSIDSRYNGFFCSVTKDNCVTTENVSVEDVLNRIIVVGAAQNRGDREYVQAAFSNAGDGVDICAPGVDVFSTVMGGYAWKSGTSMAAPIVTSIAALVWSVDEELTGNQVKGIVCAKENTKDIVRDNESERHPLSNTYQMVNAQLSVEAAIRQKQERENNKKLDEKTLASNEEIIALPVHYSGLVIKPEGVVLKMFDAINNKNYKQILECLNPYLEQKINFLGGVTSTIFGVVAENLTLGQLLDRITWVTEVEVLECSVYNVENSDLSNNRLNEWVSRVLGDTVILADKAEVYVKYRYQYNNQYYVDSKIFYVKKYGWSGWRIMQ